MVLQKLSPHLISSDSASNVQDDDDDDGHVDEIKISAAAVGA